MASVEEESDRPMEPWEQHHAVINMPRYAYNAASVLRNGNVGFLITCAFRREKSATKEALALLREHMKVRGASNGVTTTTAMTHTDEDTPSNVDHGSEKRLKCSNDDSSTTDEKLRENPTSGDDRSGSEITKVPFENEDNDDKVKRDVTSTESAVKKNENGVHTTGENVNEVADEDKPSTEGQEFMLVKLDTMGVIYISATKESPTSVLSIVSRIMKDVQARARPPPQWCHRMLPVQGTSSTNGEEVQALVSRLVKEYLDNNPSGEEPIKYAVAFNRRGGDGNTEEKAFDRGECIKIVTAAVNQVTSNLKVDLTSPKMVVIVELIPVAGARSSLICAISVLPGDLVNSKPKVTVKPLVPQSKKRKHQ